MIRPLEASQNKGRGDDYGSGGSYVPAPYQGTTTHHAMEYGAAGGGSYQSPFWIGRDPETGTNVAGSGIHSVSGKPLATISSGDPIYSSTWYTGKEAPSVSAYTAGPPGMDGFTYAPGGPGTPALPTSGETAQSYAPSQFQFPGSGGWVSAGQATRT